MCGKASCLCQCFFNVIDGSSFLIFLALFILPMKEVSRSVKRVDRINCGGSEMKSKFDDIVRENLVVGAVVSGLTFICVILATVFGIYPVTLGFPVLPGSLRMLEITANCAMQMYGIRGYFVVKDYWKPYFSSALTSDDKSGGGLKATAATFTSHGSTHTLFKNLGKEDGSKADPLLESASNLTLK
jgi:hypothetical protein